MLRSGKHSWFSLVGMAFLLLQRGNSSSRAQAPGADVFQNTPAKTIHFTNGRWFDGKEFVTRDFYSVAGVLRRKPAGSVDAVVDLQGGYVVPPFGDAHNHMFDSAFNIREQTQMYLKDGIFYAQTLCNSLAGAREVAKQVNNPASVDVKYAHGCLTGNNSHPILVYEGLGLGYYSYAAQEAHKEEILKSRRRENDCYYIVDTATELEAKWPRILAGKPDILKVILLHSENYAQRKQAQGWGEGIDPELLPQIVTRAHKAGLRVSAHVDTATDFHNALTAGVDEMAHLPGYFINKQEATAPYHLAEEDIVQAARRKVFVVPTASLTDSITDDQDWQRARANQLDNLTRLKKAGVKFGIGTDSYGTDALKEALYLSKTGVWSNLEMLKMWCEDTPRFSFPQHKIGFLRDGYEASFLVLTKNPLEQFENVQTIRLRFKEGHPLIMSQ